MKRFTLTNAQIASLAKRRQTIIELRAAGKTLQEIGDKYGISRERVRAILAKAAQGDQVAA